VELFAVLFWVIMVGSIAWTAWWYVWLPKQANALFLEGRRIEATRLLEKVIERKTWTAAELRDLHRYQLAWYHMADGRYDEAAEQLRIALRRKLKPAAESAFRERLADCMDGAGDSSGAAEERRKAAELLSKGKRGFDSYAAEGQALDRERRYLEAAAAYEKALERVPAWFASVRPQLMIQAGLACFNAARVDAARAWGEQALAAQPNRQMSMFAHALLGAAAAASGDLSAAEEHRTQALELAEAEENQNLAGEYLAQLAEVQYRRGSITQALATCDRASGMSLSARRMARIVEAECLRLRGRFDAALTALDQAARTQPYPEPAVERRFQAVLEIARAQVALDTHDPGTARAILSGLGEEPGADIKLHFWRDGLLAWALAEAGEEAECRRFAESLSQRASQFQADSDTYRGYQATLGHVHLALGETEAAIEAWRRCLELGADPVTIPTHHFHLGEAYLRLGDGDAAQREFQAAVDAGGDTWPVRRAEERLGGG
jgi:tetratricopeptide (TPR) repeat protein